MNRATAAVVVERDYVGLSPASSRDSGGGAASAPEKNEESRICELEEEEEEEEGDLELGLSLGAKRQLNGGSRSSPWGEYCRILTAKDFPSVGSRSPSASSVSSSSPASVFASVASDATAGSVSPPSQAVIGWPPIRTFRMNTLVNQKNNEAICSKGQEKNGVHVASTRFVKVNMDGDPIGRKVDLNAHLTYETLALSLEAMFEKPTIALGSSTNGSKASKLLDGSSEFALTYEDKDGDWMLVGDVPWGMFLETVKRLRIMRTLDANGLSSRFPTSGHS